MKMSFIFSTIVSLCLVSYISTIGKNFLSSDSLPAKRKLMKSHQDPPAPPEAAASNTTVVPANANAAAKESTAAGTNVIAGANNATNAVGHIGPNTHSVTDSPYKITSCDQVLLIDGLQTITDYKDYCVKAPVYFTLNVYFVNLFESKDSAKLTNSISFDKLRFPTIMEGAKGCVLFQNSQTLNRLPICGTEEQANQIIEAYKSFLDCRAGDNLKESVPKSSAPVQLNQLDPALQAAAMAAAGEELARKQAIGKLNPYYDPNTVPGSIIENFQPKV